MLDILGYADTGILDFETDVAFGVQNPGRDPDLAFVGEFDGIGHQVEKNLLQLDRIGPHHRDLRGLEDQT